MDVQTVCQQAKIFKFLNSCILLSFGPIDTKHEIFPNFNVLFLAMWVSCCLSHNKHHHHHQSLFKHEIVSLYMVFLGIVFKIRLKYSKELFDYKVKNTKTYIINNKSYNESWCIKIIFPLN